MERDLSQEPPDRGPRGAGSGKAGCEESVGQGRSWWVQLETGCRLSLRGPPSPYLCEDDDGCLPLPLLPALQVGQRWKVQRRPACSGSAPWPWAQGEGQAGSWAQPMSTLPPPPNPGPGSQVLLSGVGTPLFDLLLLLLYPLATHWLPGVGQAWDGQGVDLALVPWEPPAKVRARRRARGLHSRLLGCASRARAVCALAPSVHVRESLGAVFTARSWGPLQVCSPASWAGMTQNGPLPKPHLPPYLARRHTPCG